MAPPEPSAALILRSPDGRVLVGRRSPTASFLGGFAAFLGGRVDPGDRALAARLFGAETPEACAKVAAIRELLEETQLLLVASATAGRVRLEATDAGHMPLSAAYEAHGSVPPGLGDLAFAGRWVTPESFSARYDTSFFVAEVDAATEARVDPGELTWAAFRSPAEVLLAHRELGLLLPRPTRAQLEVLDAHPGADAVTALRTLAKVAEGADEAHGLETQRFGGGAPMWTPAAEPASGIWQLPLRTPTLPPATHTNCYVIGHDRAIVVDPAAYDPGERAVLGAVLDGLAHRGKHFEAVVLTHHHGDHIGAAAWTAERLGVPVLAHPETRKLLAGRVETHGDLVEGDRIDLGTDASGEPFVLELLHTPGHAAGHLVLVDTRRGERGLIVGDMVAAVGTIIVDPSEGSMSEYIGQLRRLRALPEAVLYPAHGPPIAAGHAKLEAYIEHRLRRERIVREALRSFGGPAQAKDLLPFAYADTPQRAWPLAERSCLAHLEKLVEDGEVRVEAGSFRLISETKTPS